MMIIVHTTQMVGTTWGRLGGGGVRGVFSCSPSFADWGSYPLPANVPVHCDSDFDSCLTLILTSALFLDIALDWPLWNLHLVPVIYSWPLAPFLTTLHSSPLTCCILTALLMMALGSVPHYAITPSAPPPLIHVCSGHWNLGMLLQQSPYILVGAECED